MMNHKILVGDALEILKGMETESVNCIVTSPPYWGLRDYGIDGQIGLEPTLDEFLSKILSITSELKRVLRNDGVMFWNHGDCYGGSWQDYGAREGKQRIKNTESFERKGNPKKDSGIPPTAYLTQKCMALQHYRLAIRMVDEQGWILRNIVIWNKPNHMPSSVKDRFSNSYEPVFMFVKSKKYWFDLDAVRKPHQNPDSKAFNIRVRDVQKGRIKSFDRIASDQEVENYEEGYQPLNPLGKNPGDVWRTDERAEIAREQGMITMYSHSRRPRTGFKHADDVWTIPTQPFKECHFAVFPEKLIEPMLKAGCPKEICVKCGKPRVRIVETYNPSKEFVVEDGRSKSLGQDVASLYKNISPDGKSKGVYYSGKTTGWTKCDCGADFRAGVVLDPFVGSGTTCVVAEKLGLNSIGIELSLKYVDIIERRMKPFTRQMNIMGHRPMLEVVAC